MAVFSSPRCGSFGRSTFGLPVACEGGGRVFETWEASGRWRVLGRSRGPGVVMSEETRREAKKRVAQWAQARSTGGAAAFSTDASILFHGRFFHISTLDLMMTPSRCPARHTTMTIAGILVATTVALVCIPVPASAQERMPTSTTMMVTRMKSNRFQFRLGRSLAHWFVAPR